MCRISHFEVCLKMKGKTAVHGCRCSVDVAVCVCVCVCKVVAKQYVGARLSLALMNFVKIEKDLVAFNTQVSNAYIS